MPLFQSLSVLLLVLALGFACQRQHLFSNEQINGLETFLFQIAMPCYLFSSILSQDLKNLLNSAYIASYLLSFVSTAFVILFFQKSYANCSIPQLHFRILAAAYVNTSIYTLPIITILLGNPIAALLGALIQASILQPLSLMSLSFFQQQGTLPLQKLLKILLTPLILLPIAGIILNGTCVKLPFCAQHLFTTLGSSAPSLALFIFGLSLGKIHLEKQLFSKDILLTVFFKNIVHPLIALGIGYYLFHLEGYWLQALILTSTAPTAFVIYLMAKQFSIQAHFVRSVIALSSMVSLVTLMLITSFLFFK